MKKVKVFMIGYSSNKGGVESYISNLTNQLDHTKFEIIYSLPIMEIDGKKWVRPQNRHNYLHYKSFWKKFYRENHFDAVYYNTCDVVSIDQLKFAKAYVPIRIIHSHNSGNQQEIGKEMSYFHKVSEKKNRKNLHKYATHFFACSKLAGDWMFDGRDYEIIHNGIDISKYHFDSEKRNKCRKKIGIDDEKLIGCIGRLSPQKNPFFTLDIAAEFIQQDPTAKLVMIGDGKLASELRDKIKEKGLVDKVILTGAVDNVYEWMSAIDCLIMPSLFEGLPFVLVEAQAAGLKCVVSSNVSEEANITGLVEYLNLESGAAKWAETALAACTTQRPNVDKELIDAGYSIQTTAETVSKAIETALHKKDCMYG